jgi:hypothetical protein
MRLELNPLITGFPMEVPVEIWFTPGMDVIPSIKDIAPFF